MLLRPLLVLCPLVSALALQTPGPPAPQDPRGAAGGVSREEMWYAPSAEDWNKPCLVRWQRSYADAERVSEESGKPILVCINMDGEIASEHYAGIRYRQPEIAALYEPYVCVIASVYRHTPRDYDEHGGRIVCPRFGSVTCGEHMRIEPGLFKNFLDDTRVAPRHIMVENGSDEQFDVYYAFDTQSVFNTLRAGIEEREPALPTLDRGDQSLLERVSSRAVRDREALEQAYRSGDRSLRRELLTRAVATSGGTHMELLRLALFGEDAELSQVAWRSLVGTESLEALPLITEVMRLELERTEREALIESLERLGTASPKAKRLARVQRGLADAPQGFDLQSWRLALGADGAGTPWPGKEELAARVEWSEEQLQADPAHPQKALAHAAALYDLAFQVGLDPKLMRLTLSEAYSEAQRTLERMQDPGWDAHSLVAACAKALGRPREGYAASVRAMQFAPVDATSWRAKETLALFAEARQRAIFRAMLRKEDWPSSWMSDAHAAFEMLALHPYGTAIELAEHHDYLQALNAKGYASRVLAEGLERFPHAPQLHSRLRERLLKEKDLAALDGLEQTYEGLLREAGEEPSPARGDLHWYAGYASLVAAEFHRRAAEPLPAAGSYARAMEHFEVAALEALDTSESCQHFIALAHAGLARLALEAEDYGHALAEILQCFERSPDSGASRDGMGITPVMTAKTLLARLSEGGLEPSAATLKAALEDLPPRVLETPAWDRETPRTGAAGRRGLRNGRRPR